MSLQHLPKIGVQKLALVVALTLISACAVFAQPAASQGPAAPFITKPGVSEVFHDGSGTFTARVFCGNWKGVVQFTAGTQGRNYVTRSVYVCQTTESAVVRFTVRPGELGPGGTTSTASRSAGTPPTALSPGGRTRSPAASPSARHALRCCRSSAAQAESDSDSA